MADNSVVPFSRNKPCKDLLEAAIAENFETIYIVGEKRDGEGWIGSGNMSNESAIWFMECAKRAILDA